ncbi:DUF1491 family protein [Varunaivibrio sulfuroxidans]|uniref:DUF1491 family protein n=1 Tax=Varunaivibrio sulfuroxidans TaxID=1773489 RepID=A0A4R3JC58_9PROT|nr:DUF1491 family protein [Varunaivibrio sulfuroxidans]TCS62935.1 hypothetical protein EDD55_10424 [Varunaivibrio sulfuroxidans]WES31989.1 DUF1491 family protein [Varunaivibrio sulfuroxidans]
MSARLKTEIWVAAMIRRYEAQGVPVMVIAKGDVDGGAVLVKHNRFAAGCRLYAQVRTPEGAAAWMAVAGGDKAGDDARAQEMACDDYIRRERDIDPDVWAIEVEDARGVFTPDGAVVS